MNPGTQLGPYRVESLIGAGGMGEVYLGVDTRLDRQVAIKVLSGSLASDPALRERFQREARTISSLSHPNICTLFDLGEHEGSDFLVMEYLQGESLADRITRGPMPPREVLRIGAGIATALEAAHRQGIIHRDLKPGNVMLTKSGVKLLDFGLAKLSAVASAAGAATATMTLGATEQKPLTEQGTILGTFQYMAPEQLEGLPADARTDIFGLGAILYEMATGRRAFQGATKASLIAAIIDRDPPPMTELQPLTPPALERLTRACLAKDPDERFQTAHDVAMELRWLSEATSSSMTPVELKRRKRFAPWAVAALFAIAAVAAGILLWREKGKPPPPYSGSIVAPRGYNLQGAVVAPNGRSVALLVIDRKTRTPSLWIRQLDDGTQRKLVEGIVQNPFWSPDSAWIGYRAAPDQLLRIRVDGGNPERIATTFIQGQPTWGEDGTILFSPGFGHGLSRVAASGGEIVPVTKLDAARGESIHATPRFLPKGKRFLYLSHTTAEKRNEIWAGSLDGKPPVRVVVADAVVGYSKPYLLFVRDGAAWAQRFDTDDLEVSGEARRVVDDVAYFESEAQAAVSLANDGTLLYASYPTTRIQLNLFERNGALASTLWEASDVSFPQLSADEKSLVVSKFDRAKGADDIWFGDLSRGLLTKITSGLATHLEPRLSPDGQTIAFYSDRIGMFDIYVQPADGSAPARVLWKDQHDKTLCDWSPDGRFLLISLFSPVTKGDLWVLPVDGGKPWELLASENREGGARFSPDGAWIAYTVSAEGEPEIYLRPFPKGRAVRVSTDGGGVPAWRADGRELVWSSKGRIMAAAIDLSGPTPSIGKPQELFRLPFIWSTPLVTREGRIGVLVPAPDEETEIPAQITTAWRRNFEKAQK